MPLKKYESVRDNSCTERDKEVASLRHRVNEAWARKKPTETKIYLSVQGIDRVIVAIVAMECLHSGVTAVIEDIYPHGKVLVLEEKM